MKNKDLIEKIARTIYGSDEQGFTYETDVEANREQYRIYARAALSAMQPEWLPIESAKESKEPILGLAWYPNETEDMAKPTPIKYHTGGYTEGWVHRDSLNTMYASLYMPLPTPKGE